MFQLTAARRRLDECASPPNYANMFQLTAARRRLVIACCRPTTALWFQLTAARRRLGHDARYGAVCVGFNSQPPEGGWRSKIQKSLYCRCFNSQPPEGGWQFTITGLCCLPGFNSQPPEGGWISADMSTTGLYWFQLTAARRRLAAVRVQYVNNATVSTHSRPKAAGISRVTAA